MPTYDYACRFCEHSFEYFQGISEPLKRKCPSCGRMGLDRLFGTGIGVVFKGSGFYETDYKRASRKDPAGESKQSEPSAESGPSAASSPKDKPAQQGRSDKGGQRGGSGKGGNSGKDGSDKTGSGRDGNPGKGS